jgi:hypothetical protein
MSNNYSTIESDLKTYFTTNFVNYDEEDIKEENPIFDIYFENEYNNDRDMTKPFICFYILFGAENPMNIGKTTRETRLNGNLQIEIFIPTYQGITLLLNTIDQLSNLFRNKKISSITTNWPTINKNIEIKDGYEKSIVNINFYKDLAL